MNNDEYKNYIIGLYDASLGRPSGQATEGTLSFFEAKLEALSKELGRKLTGEEINQYRENDHIRIRNESAYLAELLWPKDAEREK